MDANELVAHVAYRLSECLFVYPISPATPIGESVDVMYSKGKRNIFGDVPALRQLQSEAGAAGAVHGALLTGSLSSTFTASQGLLLMVPMLYKFVGEELPAVLHVASRSIATHALSIHCSHDDVYSCASTGIAMLCSESVSASRCNALVAHIASVVGSYPIIHFFDGYTVSHHSYCVSPPTDEEIKEVMEQTSFATKLAEFHSRRMNAAMPNARGGYMGPGTFYAATDARKHHRKLFAESLFEVMRVVKGIFPDAAEPAPFVYTGDKTATHIIVVMGSAGLTLEEALAGYSRKDRLGIVKVQLFRPFLHEALSALIPPTAQCVCVLERADTDTQAVLYGDVAYALTGRSVEIIRGSYGLSSTDFAPGNACAVMNNLLKPKEQRKNPFVVGIDDDVTHEALNENMLVKEDNANVIIFGFGSDGSVGASKSLVRVVRGEGDYEYDSYKSGGLTMCNIRLGVTRQHYYRPETIKMGVVTTEMYISRFGEGLVDRIEEGGILFLNTSRDTAEALAEIVPVAVRRAIVARKLSLKTVDASGLAAKVKGGRGANILIMAAIIKQLRHFERDEDAMQAIQGEIQHLYGRQGDEVVAQNMRCAEAGLKEENMHLVSYDAKWPELPESEMLLFRQRVIEHETKKIVKLDDAPALGGVTSVFSAEKHVASHLGGVYDQLGLNEVKASSFIQKGVPVGLSAAGTTAVRPRMIASVVPVWNSAHCIQCCQCAFNCPHGVIRTFVVDEGEADSECVALTSPLLKKQCDDPGRKRFVIKVNAVQCTGCSVCATVCPGNKMLKAKTDNEEPLTLQMTPVSLDLMEGEYEGFQRMEAVRGLEKEIEEPENVQILSLKKPLFAYSGGCAGCGELTYLVTLSRLYDNALIFNATGCSSIYGHGFPCTPYQKGFNNYGLAWANSLFEDNAEFGYGGAISYNYRRNVLYSKLAAILAKHKEGIPTGEAEDKLTKLLERLLDLDVWDDPRESRRLATQIAVEDKEHTTVPAEYISDIPRSHCFIVGGDGWAFDIGFGGLDHVLAECCQQKKESIPNITIIVLDSQLYSNTGGQRSKATPFSAVVKLACNKGNRGNPRYSRKDLLFTALQYGCYYAAVSFSHPNHMLACLREAGANKGVSLVRCLSPCIDHGITGGLGNRNSIVNSAVKSGIFPLFSYNPATNKAKLGSEIPTTTMNDDLKAWVKGQRRTSGMSEEDMKTLAQEFDETNRKLKRLADIQ